MFGKICRLFLVIFILFIIIGGGIFYQLYSKSLHQPMQPSINGSTILHVPHGANIMSIADELVHRKIIPQAWPLVIYGKIQGNSNQLKSGDYRLKPNNNLIQLYNDIIHGDVITHAITIIEGSTYAQLRQAIREAPDLKQTLGQISDEELAKKLGIDGKLEGQFLPNTYYYSANDSDFSLLKRLHQQLEKVLNKEWQHRANNLAITTPYQALTMASIIEKETRLANERPLVAGVMHRRLKKKMKLQMDPTVIYGLSHFNGNITRQDLKTDTPYNTYIRDGLPPTPISLPSEASIHAALHPDGGKSLYFVANGDGGHTFSETYSSHLQAVKRLIEKTRKNK